MSVDEHERAIGETPEPGTVLLRLLVRRQAPGAQAVAGRGLPDSVEHDRREVLAHDERVGRHVQVPAPHADRETPVLVHHHRREAVAQG